MVKRNQGDNPETTRESKIAREDQNSENESGVESNEKSLNEAPAVIDTAELNQRLRNIIKVINNETVSIESAINKMKELLLSSEAPLPIENGPILTSFIENRNRNISPEQRLEIVQLLVNNGADINFLADEKVELEEEWSDEENGLGIDAEQTPLMTASYHGDTNIVEYLLECPGIKVNIADNNGYTALASALLDDNHAEIVEALLGAGAEADKPNNLNETPLLKACLNGQAKTVRLLLVGGANANQNINNVPILVKAARTNIHIVQALLDHGANIDNGQDHPILEEADQSDIIQLLVRHGANINHTYDNNYSYLMDAALNGLSNHALALIENDIDTTLTDYSGRTALMIAYDKSSDADYLNQCCNIIDLLLIKESDPQSLPNDYEGKEWLIERSGILNAVGKDFTKLPDNHEGKEWLVNKKEETLESITQPIIERSKSILKSHQYSNNAVIGIIVTAFKNNMLISGEDISKIVKKHNPKYFPAAQINAAEGQNVAKQNNQEEGRT